MRGENPAIRLAARRQQAAPIIAALKPWREARLSRIPRRSRSAEDIRYTLAHRPGLILDDGILELGANPVENQIRPIALTRKNALFAGNEVGAESRAMLASLVATCRMSSANPVDDLAATLRAVLGDTPNPASRTSCPGGTPGRQALPRRRACAWRLRMRGLPFLIFLKRSRPHRISLE